LASSQARLPASLYFVGFTGGVLTVGVIGIIAGPLAVAVLVEVIDLLSEGGTPMDTD
jgi:predicted PurR-regulated permease PerM